MDFKGSLGIFRNVKYNRSLSQWEVTLEEGGSWGSKGWGGGWSSPSSLVAIRYVEINCVCILIHRWEEEERLHLDQTKSLPVLYALQT